VTSRRGNLQLEVFCIDVDAGILSSNSLSYPPAYARTRHQDSGDAATPKANAHGPSIAHALGLTNKNNTPLLTTQASRWIILNTNSDLYLNLNRRMNEFDLLAVLFRRRLAVSRIGMNERPARVYILFLSPA
jgi:hypothetical protein